MQRRAVRSDKSKDVGKKTRKWKPEKTKSPRRETTGKERCQVVGFERVPTRRLNFLCSNNEKVSPKTGMDKFISAILTGTWPFVMFINL